MDWKPSSEAIALPAAAELAGGPAVRRPATDATAAGRAISVSAVDRLATDAAAAVWVVESDVSATGASSAGAAVCGSAADVCVSMTRREVPRAAGAGLVFVFGVRRCPGGTLAAVRDAAGLRSRRWKRPGLQPQRCG